MENHALAVAIMSFNGNLDFGLLGDYDALRDIDVPSPKASRPGFQELLAVARAKAHRPAQPRAGENGASQSNGQRDLERGPSPVLPSPHGRAKRGPAADMRAKRARGSRPDRKRRSDA